jgi:hypothetical protein
MVDTVYQLEVTLRHIRPPIWRRLRVPGKTTLGQLHDVLQIALGWTNSHLHQFLIGRETFGMPDLDGPPTTNEKGVRLDKVAGAKSTFVYEYDFGDGWEHDVVVERVDTSGATDLVPVCMDGRRACPPEDCGGPHGYEHLLQALANPKHPDHAEMSEWIAPDWRAEAFDIDLVNQDLRALGARWRRPSAPRSPRAGSATRRAND